MPCHSASAKFRALSTCLLLTVGGCDGAVDITERGIVSVGETGHDVLVVVHDELGIPMERARVTYAGVAMEALGGGVYRRRLLRPVGGLVVRVAAGGYDLVERRIPEDAAKRENQEIYDVTVFLSVE